LVYYFSRFLIRLALPLFLRRLCIINKHEVPVGAPVLLASSHAGSFFDALVIGSVLSQPIHTLTRGDVFRKPKVAVWLRRIKLVPVFRGSEGRENLKQIDSTLQECVSILQEKGTVVIFSEGVCVNEWRLRPLGKGTARLAYQAWYGPDPALHELAVIPTGVTYEHFRGANKRVRLQFGQTLRPQELTTPPAEYEKWLREFNALLEERLGQTLLIVPAEAKAQETSSRVKAYFESCPSPRGNGLLRVLGQLGRALNRPLYRLYTRKVASKTRGTVFYDSVLFGLLIYTYPVLIGLMALLVGALAGWAAGLVVFIGFPLLGSIGNRYRSQG
jgi:1-acyl-sn-glycerol-3-phosphate acyltransferase